MHTVLFRFRLDLQSLKKFFIRTIQGFHKKRPWTGCRKWMKMTAAYKKKVFTLLDINWRCLSIDRWHQLFGLMLQTCFGECSVLSVVHRNKKMCLDVVFGSCCLPGMTVDAHITHEVDFLFIYKVKRLVVIFLTFLLIILCTFCSQYHN